MHVAAGRERELRVGGAHGLRRLGRDVQAARGEKGDDWGGVFVEDGHDGSRKERPSFLKKRSKKLLDLGLHLSGSAYQVAKVFWFFFSKKNILHVH
jgi:hypothetical protein